MAHQLPKEKRSLNIALLTVSDTRTLETDTSGSFQQALEEEGHQLVDRQLVIDDIYQMRAMVSAWIADPKVEVIVTTGGISTPAATAPRKHWPHFSTSILKALVNCFASSPTMRLATPIPVPLPCRAGQQNRHLLPARLHRSACKTGWNGILRDQLNSTFAPCNFVQHVGARPK